METTELIVDRAASSNSAAPVIVWVDDFIDAFDLIALHLEQLGYKVLKYSNFDDIDVDLSEVKYYIIDNKIGADTHAGERFIERGQVSSESRVVLFSGYISVDYFSNPIDVIGRKVRINHYYKDSPPDSMGYAKSTAEAFAKFFRARGEKDQNESQPRQRGGVMSYYDYKALPFEIRAEFNQQFYERNRARIQDIFSKGAVLAVWFEDGADPELVANAVHEIPDDDYIEMLALRDDRTPFVFQNNIQFDDTPAPECESKTRDVSSYPVANIDVGSIRSLHFDSGSDSSFLNARFVAEINARTVGVDRTFMHRNGPYTARKTAFRAVVPLYTIGEKFAKKGNRRIEVNGWAVAMWEKSPFVVRCSDNCRKLGEKVVSGVCQFRSDGLLGRTVTVDNELDIYVHTKSRNVYFIDGGGDEPDGGAG